MCLTSEWFAGSKDRIDRWDKEGVTPDEARKALAMMGSTAYPVAAEMAAWLYEHWTVQQIDALGPGYRSDFLRAIGDPGISFQVERGYYSAVKLLPLGRLPSPCIIRHCWEGPALPNVAFIAIFQGTAAKHVVLHGNKTYQSVEEWVQARRRESWNEGKELRFHIDGTCPQPWWAHVEFLHEGRWMIPVERLVPQKEQAT
jgi:hypothetical protein